MNNPKQVYGFHREYSFYLLELSSDEEACKNAECNPGTLMVTTPGGRVVWDPEAHREHREPDHIVDANKMVIRESAPAAGSGGISFEEWERQGGDTDRTLRTVCHACDRMFPVEEMTVDDRFDNICPHCTADRRNDEAHGQP